MPTVLVTRGLGVIGSRLVPHLREHGYAPKVLDNKAAKSHDYIRADICSGTKMMEAFERRDIDRVLPVAAEVGRESNVLFARRKVDTKVGGILFGHQLRKDVTEVDRVTSRILPSKNPTDPERIWTVQSRSPVEGHRGLEQ